MVETIFVVLDIATLVLGLVAFVMAWVGVSKIEGKGALKSAGIWFVIGILLLLLRKVFDSIGEYLFTASNMMWNTLEDLAFLLAIITLLYSAYKVKIFFSGISFNK